MCCFLTHRHMRLQPCVNQAGRYGIGRRRPMARLLQDHGERLGGSQDIRVRRNGERRAVPVLRGCAAGRGGTCEVKREHESR